MSSSPNSSSSSDARGVGLEPLQWLMDVPCPVDFVLGTTTVKVRDCAAFAVDAVIRLKQTAGADLEVRVSGVPMFSGEVVIVDDNVALRVGRVLAPIGLESV
jgi:flagellar motor switch/type III secretory pathway protein FliN